MTCYTGPPFEWLRSRHSPDLVFRHDDGHRDVVRFSRYRFFDAFFKNRADGRNAERAKESVVVSTTIPEPVTRPVHAQCRNDHCIDSFERDRSGTDWFIDSPPGPHERVFADEPSVFEVFSTRPCIIAYNDGENDLFFLRIEPRNERPRVYLPSLLDWPVHVNASSGLYFRKGPKARHDQLAATCVVVDAQRLPELAQANALGGLVDPTPEFVDHNHSEYPEE